MIRPHLTCKKFFLAVVLSFSVLSTYAANRYSVASGNWNSTATWSSTSGGAPGASVPGKNDDVYIENGHTVTVTEDYECGSVTFTGVSATLAVNSPATLTVKTSVTLNKLTNSNSACRLTGTGTLTCVEVIVGTTTNPPPTGPSSSVYTHTFTSDIAILDISIKGAPRNDIAINSYIGGTTHLRNGVFNLEGGIVNVDGQITTSNQNSANTSTLSMATGAAAGTLNLRGKASPFILSGTGTNAINLNGTGSLVNYSMTLAQTVLGTAYNNLTLSGSGAKTVSGATVNGTLSLEGTATASGTTPTFGTLSALQYKGSAAQTTGIEFPATFGGAGGIILSNSNGVTLNNNRTISSKLTFVNGRINTGIYILSMTSSASVEGAGTAKYVYGTLQKGFATGTTTKTFEIGDATVYAPVTLDFTGTISVEGSISATTTYGEHPSIGSSTLNSSVDVNRYWTLTNSGVSGFISYSATFSFISGDVDPGADYNYFYVGNYDASTWTYPAVGTLASTSTQAKGMISFGDFQIGELPVASFRTRQSGDWSLTSTWESFNGTSWANATSTPTSTSGYIIIRPTHTATVTTGITVDQVIIETGGRLNVNTNINVNNGAAIDLSNNGTLDCVSGNLTGAGSFLISSLAEIIIRSPDGISATGSTGNIQTTERTFNQWANYTYSGTSAQITGSGLPASVNNMTINNPSGVSLTASVIVNGTLTLTSGAFSTGTGTLTFLNSDLPVVRTSGTITTSQDSNLAFGTSGNTAGADFTIPAGCFTSAPTINNLTIYRTNNLTLNDQVLSLRGTLLCNGPLNTNGNLTLLSTAAQTALIDGTSTGTVSNNVTMQRYLPSAFGYKYISSPFQASTVNEFSDDIDLAASWPVLYKYDESRASSGWVKYVTPSDLLNPLEGYAANFGSAAIPLTADLTGIVNNGALSATLSNHNNTYTLGFNLVGNPYPSPINWDAVSGWTKTNIDDALYYFKASTTDEYGGTYSTYINKVSSDGLATAIIPSMQGFFIHVSDGTFPVTGTLGLNNSVRVTDLTHSFIKSGEKGSIPLLRIGAGFADDTTSTDPMVIYFDEKAETGFDSYLDAFKLMNTDYNVPNLYSIGTDGSKLSINALPVSTDTLCRIPLGLKINLDGYIIFSIIDLDEQLSGKEIYISDLATGIEQDLINKNYLVNLKAGEYNDRFFLNLHSVPTEIPDIKQDNDLFSVYTSYGVVKAFINTDKIGPGTLSIINVTGKVMLVRSISESGYIEFNPGILDGIYIITFTSGNYRISKKVFIQNR